MCDNALDLLGIVTEFLQRGLNCLIDNFQHAATCEQLIFYQRDIRFDAGRVAIHQETDRARRREHRDLRIAITVTLSEFGRAVPNCGGFLFQMRELFRIRYLADRAAMQLDHFQH